MTKRAKKRRERKRERKTHINVGITALFQAVPMAKECPTAVFIQKLSERKRRS